MTECTNNQTLIYIFLGVLVFLFVGFVLPLMSSLKKAQSEVLNLKDQVKELEKENDKLTKNLKELKSIDVLPQPVLKELEKLCKEEKRSLLAQVEYMLTSDTKDIEAWRTNHNKVFYPNKK